MHYSRGLMQAIWCNHLNGNIICGSRSRDYRLASTRHQTMELYRPDDGTFTLLSLHASVDDDKESPIDHPLLLLSSSYPLPHDQQTINKRSTRMVLLRL